MKNDFKTPGEMHNFELDEILKYCIKLENGNYQVDPNTGCMNVKTVQQNYLYVCPECGYLYGSHSNSCSFVKKCEYCGYNFSSRKHSPDCPLFKPLKVCEECLGKGGKHKKNCSHYIPNKRYPMCGNPVNIRKKDCPNHKNNRQNK